MTRRSLRPDSRQGSWVGRLWSSAGLEFPSDSVRFCQIKSRLLPEMQNSGKKDQFEYRLCCLSAVWPQTDCLMSLIRDFRYL